MQLAVPTETRPGERRVALVPDVVKKLVAAGWQIAVQSGAGVAAAFSDQAYEAAGATIAPDAAAVHAGAGLINLTSTLAVEWAPGVRVNCVSAGLLVTDAGDEHYGGADGLARVAATVPAGRMGSPHDVAQACLFLASAQAAFVTGANLVVHGGGEWPACLTALEDPAQA